MNVIILAAGKGSRLRPLTNNIPKGMIKFLDQTLVERQVEIYHNCSINDITIVTGYKSEMFNVSDVNYIKNENFEITNMNESLFCARDKLNDSTLVSYSDIVFEQKIIEQMIEFDGSIGLAVNLDWKKNYNRRTLHPLAEAENVLIENGKILQIRKNISQCEPDQQIGEFMGIMKLSKNGAKILLDQFLFLHANHKGSFHNSSSLQEAYITDMLQNLIDSGIEIKPIFVNGDWFEIDTPEDLQLAENLFNSKYS